MASFTFMLVLLNLPVITLTQTTEQSTAVPVPPPTVRFIKDDKYVNQTEMYTQGLIRAQVNIKFYAGYQSDAGFMVMIDAISDDGFPFGEVQEPTSTSSGNGIIHGQQSIVNGLYSLMGISVNVESDKQIVIRLTMATVSNTSLLEDDHVYTWRARLSYGDVEVIDTLDFRTNLAVVEEAEIPKLKITLDSGNDVLHPGDQISGTVTATFPQYFYGSFKLRISTVYNETTNSIFGYFTRDPRKFMTVPGVNVDWSGSQSYIGSTAYFYEVTCTRADFPTNLESNREANIDFDFILSNTPDIQNDTNYTFFATLETENTDVIHTGLQFTTDLTTQAPEYNASVAFPSIMYVNQPAMMLIRVDVRGKSAQSIKINVESNELTTCQRDFFNLDSFCGDPDHVSHESTETSENYDFGTVVNCIVESEETNLDLYLGFVLENRSADTLEAVVTVLINDEPLPSGQLNGERLVFQVEDPNPYQYESYGPDIEEPTMRFSSNTGVSEYSTGVKLYLSIPKLQNRSYTLVPKWKSSQLESSNLKIINIDKYSTSLDEGLNIPCVTRPVTDVIPGRSVMLGRMVNGGYNDENSYYNEIYAKVTVTHEMCNLHTEGANPFYIYAHYSPTQFVYVQSSVNYVPVETTQLTVSQTDQASPVVVECSPTNDVLVSTTVNCKVNVTFAESYTFVKIDIFLTTSPEDLFVFKFIHDAIHVHTVGSRLTLNTEAFSYQLNSSEDAMIDEKLLTNIGSVELIERTCPSGWQINGNKCYAYVGNASSYNDAIRMCNDVNGTVLSILSEQENTFVRQLANNSVGSLGIWLGITDSSIEGDWIWANGKNDSQYSNWQTLKACDWTVNCAVIDVDGTWIFKQCEGLELDIAVVCEKEFDEEVQEASLCMDFAFIPLSSPQDYINIDVSVNKDGLKENRTMQVSIMSDPSARPVLQLIYEFNSSESYNLGSSIPMNFSLEHSSQSTAGAANVYIMFYLPRSFQAVVSESPMFTTTHYGGKLLISNFHFGSDPLLFQLQFVVTSGNSIFKGKPSVKASIFISTVYNQTYFEGGDYDEDHLFETKNLLRIDVINNSPDPYIPVGWDKGCTSPVALGMESGYIQDCQITSLEAPDNAAPAHNARLNMPNTAWKIYSQHGLDIHDTWLAIDLLRNATITSIATQGGSRVGTSNDFEGTTGSFQFLYGTKNGVYMIATPRIQTDSNHRSYFEHAILDPSAVKHHYLLSAVDARFVLIKLERHCSQNINSLRIELFGCYYEENGEQSNEECDNRNSHWSDINVADRGFMVVDGQLFVCNSLPLKLEYADTAAGNGLYYLFTSHNRSDSYCLQRQSDSSSWSRLSTDVSMLLGYDSQSLVIYGTRNSRHNKTVIRSIDRGRSWQTISLWKYFDFKSSGTFVPITSVPSTSTDDMNWLNPSNILNEYISENRGASYDGLYEYTDNTWRKILDWNQCCTGIHSTNTMTQSCVID